MKRKNRQLIGIVSVIALAVALSYIAGNYLFSVFATNSVTFDYGDVASRLEVTLIGESWSSDTMILDNRQYATFSVPAGTILKQIQYYTPQTAWKTLWLDYYMVVGDVLIRKDGSKVLLICAQGETKCQNGDAYICSSDRSAWQLKEQCQYGCTSGVCNSAPVCTPNALDCEGNTLRRCETGKQWVVVEECEYGCDSDKLECKLEIVPPDMNIIIVVAAMTMALIGVLIVIKKRKK